MQVLQILRQKLTKDFSDFWIIKTDSIGNFYGKIQLVVLERMRLKQYFKLLIVVLLLVEILIQTISGDKTEPNYGGI